MAGARSREGDLRVCPMTNRDRPARLNSLWLRPDEIASKMASIPEKAPSTGVRISELGLRIWFWLCQFRIFIPARMPTVGGHYGYHL
jgi:hypothetical protein